MFAAIRPGLTEPEGHFRSVFAVFGKKYGLARQSLDKNAYSKKGAMSVRCIQASACDDIEFDLFQGDSPSAEAYRAGLEEKGCVSSK